jgi:hypothetical protein
MVGTGRFAPADQIDLCYFHQRGMRFLVHVERFALHRGCSRIRAMLYVCGLPQQVFAGNAAIGFAVLRGGVSDDVSRELGRGRLLVPTRLAEPVAQVLLIK